MTKEDFFTIKSIIEILFKDPHLRDISYDSFSPEFKKLQTKRSKVLMEKTNSYSLIFHIESKDFTAFRATISEIINFGRIFENTLKITDIS
jgi:tRNA threonylcarbamoyladenosine modification (KEOPS) complex  Pcc1 subunit